MVAARSGNWVSHVRDGLRGGNIPPRLLFGTAVTELRHEVILAAAILAAVLDLASGHGKEKTVRTVDDFQVTDHEGIVEGH
jgi:hypothetical protein